MQWVQCISVHVPNQMWHQPPRVSFLFWTNSKKQFFFKFYIQSINFRFDTWQCFNTFPSLQPLQYWQFCCQKLVWYFTPPSTLLVEIFLHSDALNCYQCYGVQSSCQFQQPKYCNSGIYCKVSQSIILTLPPLSVLLFFMLFSLSTTTPLDTFNRHAQLNMTALDHQ